MTVPPLVALGTAMGAGAAAGSAVRTAGEGFASMLRAALGGGGKPAAASSAKPPESAAGATSKESLRAALERDVSRFGRDLAALFAREGIAAGGVSLSLDALGKVRVQGDHREKARIEALFAAKTELAEFFRTLAARAEALAAANVENDIPPGFMAGGLTAAGSPVGRFILHLDSSGARYDLMAAGL